MGSLKSFLGFFVTRPAPFVFAFALFTAPYRPACAFFAPLYPLVTLNPLHFGPIRPLLSPNDRDYFRTSRETADKNASRILPCFHSTIGALLLSWACPSDRAEGENHRTLPAYLSCLKVLRADSTSCRSSGLLILMLCFAAIWTQSFL